MPFLCFYLFGLCDSSGQVQLPSSEQCEIFSSETCASEIETVTTLFGSFLQCESLPINSVECAINGSSNIPETIRSNNSNSSSDEITCQVDFFLDNGTCRPKCGDSNKSIGNHCKFYWYHWWANSFGTFSAPLQENVSFAYGCDIE